MTDPRQPDITQAIYDGIRDVFPVDLMQYMGERRSREYAALWASTSTKRLLGGVLSQPAPVLPGLYVTHYRGDLEVWRDTGNPDRPHAVTDLELRLAVAALLPDHTEHPS